MINDDDPLVSIITPSYNQGKFVEETILSVLNQKYKNIQYIFIDGGSTDNTMEIVEKYKDKIDIIINEKDKGQADAINKGFKLAKGKLVGWINSDDILYPDCVNEIVELYKTKPNGAIFYSPNLDWLDEKNNIIAHRNVQMKNKNYLLNNNYTLIQQGSFYSLECVKKANYLDISNHYCMDLDLWLKLLNFGNIYGVETTKSLAAFRVYKGTKTDTGKIKFLNNIKSVLLRNGAKWYSKNIILRIYIYSIKIIIKDKLWPQ